MERIRSGRRLGHHILILWVLLAGAVGAQEPAASLEQASALLRSEDWVGAARAYRAVTEAEPDNAAALRELAVSHYKMAELNRSLGGNMKSDRDGCPAVGGQPSRS